MYPPMASAIVEKDPRADEPIKTEMRLRLWRQTNMVAALLLGCCLRCATVRRSWPTRMRLLSSFVQRRPWAKPTVTCLPLTLYVTTSIYRQRVGLRAHPGEGEGVCAPESECAGEGGGAAA